MARKIKFALKMPGGVSVRTIEDLKQNFDLASVLEYYFNGKLTEWLMDRKHNEYADAISKLDNDKSDFKQKLCNVFGVVYIDNEKVIVEEVAKLIGKRQILKEFTDDETILAKADEVVFGQQELELCLQDDSEQIIYLFGKEFTIPVEYKNKKYVGVDNPIIEMAILTPEELEKLNIRFENVNLPERLIKYYSKEEIIEESQYFGRCATYKSYYVSKALDYMLSEKDRKNSEKIFDLIQDGLGTYGLDLNKKSKVVSKIVEEASLKGYINYYLNRIS